MSHEEHRQRTAPYLDMCRTNSDPSLKSGRGTIAAAWQGPMRESQSVSRDWLGCSSRGWMDEAADI